MSMGMCGNDLHFNVTDRFGQQQGEMKKIHNGCWNECCSAGDKYEMTLPKDDAEAALMLAALQLMDMVVFENPYNTCNP
jgi:hypothetical protein